MGRDKRNHFLLLRASPSFGYSFIAGSSMPSPSSASWVWDTHTCSLPANHLRRAHCLFSQHLVGILPPQQRLFNGLETLQRLHLLGHADALRLFDHRLFLWPASPDFSSACMGLDIHITILLRRAHFHYIMVGGAVRAAYVGGINYGAQDHGRLYSETLSRIAVCTLFVGFNPTFFPHSFWLIGMPRLSLSHLSPEFQVLTSCHGGALPSSRRLLLPMLT